VGKRHLCIANSLYDRGTNKLKLGNIAIDLVVPTCLM